MRQFSTRKKFHRRSFSSFRRSILGFLHFIHSAILGYWNKASGRNAGSKLSNLLWRIGRYLARSIIYRILFPSFTIIFNFVFNLCTPLLNQLLVRIRKDIKYPNSVLHISYMVHIPYYMTRTLRKYGIKADYLAVNSQSPYWDKFDYIFPSHYPVTTIEEFIFFWKVVAKYEVIHSHFGIMFSLSGWELPLLKKMGRKIVVHYRGCEARERQKNMELHPDMNICQECDYNGSVCRDGIMRVHLADKFGDKFLVTTPDMKDFKPKAVHFPFFLPEIDEQKYKTNNHKHKLGAPYKVVHVTNHPGIEGIRQIETAIDHLKEKGYNINFVFLRGVSPERALQEYKDADLSIGKMKMGYYANAQIESMFLSVPAITYVRPEFMTPELERSGFIFTTLDTLEDTLEYYLGHPEELEKKKSIARSSILCLHDTDRSKAAYFNIWT